MGESMDTVIGEIGEQSHQSDKIREILELEQEIQEMSELIDQNLAEDDSRTVATNTTR